jgi:hypothetical protein
MTSTHVRIQFFIACEEIKIQFPSFSCFSPLHENKNSRAILHHYPIPTSLKFSKNKKNNKQIANSFHCSLALASLHNL